MGVAVCLRVAVCGVAVCEGCSVWGSQSFGVQKCESSCMWVVVVYVKVV